MFGGNNGGGASLSDIAALINGGGNNNLAELMALMNGGGGFGGGQGWWILIILWALWGNNGMFGNRNGNNGGNCGCGDGSGSGSSVTYNVGAEMQRGFDTQSIIQKLDGISKEQSPLEIPSSFWMVFPMDFVLWAMISSVR